MSEAGTLCGLFTAVLPAQWPAQGQIFNMYWLNELIHSLKESSETEQGQRDDLGIFFFSPKLSLETLYRVFCIVYDSNNIK